MAKALSHREKWRNSADSLGVRAAEPDELMRLVHAGLPVSRLAHFQKTTGLPWSTIGRWVRIPPRTLARRQSEARLRPEESDRVLRAASLFDQAVDLFEGDVAEVRQWLQSPQRALGGQTPIEYASTEIGAREVENLIFRLEHGIFP